MQKTTPIIAATITKRIVADDNEIMNFYNKYIKTIKLTVDDNGNFGFKIKNCEWINDKI